MLNHIVCKPYLLLPSYRFSFSLALIKQPRIFFLIWCAKFNFPLYSNYSMCWIVWCFSSWLFCYLSNEIMFQSLLRGRFLRNGRPPEDERQPSAAVRELGQLRQHHPVSGLRYNFFNLCESIWIQIWKPLFWSWILEW